MMMMDYPSSFTARAATLAIVPICPHVYIPASDPPAGTLLFYSARLLSSTHLQWAVTCGTS